MEWIEKANMDSKKESEVYSFNEYMDIYRESAQKESRSSTQYFLDMLKYFGQDQSSEYTLFRTKHPDSLPVYGQDLVIEQIVQNLTNFIEEGFNNKFLLLVGPNGSSKSSIVKKLMRGAEDYSLSDEGPLYTFSWIFPIDNYIKGTLGLNSTPSDRDVHSYAHLEDKEIGAILSSELKDHPLLLVPRKYRQELIEDSLGADSETLEDVKKTYLYKSGLSKKNRMIYDAMLRNYKGNHQEVLKHIRVERFLISKRYSSSAVTIEPQLHVDAKLQQITMDKRLASLPPGLQSLNLFSLQGEAIFANRGILEFSDLLKRPLDAFKYLLMTMETGSINLQGIVTELDIFFIGTSNEIHLAAFKQHPDFNSFNGRINFIKVPYLLNYRQEKNIYEEQVESLKHKAYFEPNALEALSLFATMTRIRGPQEKNYSNKKLSSILKTLNPLEKSLLLANEKMPNRFKIEEQQVLKHGLDEMRQEFMNENLYEGKFGISPREIKNIIFELSSKHTHITFIEILVYLQSLILKRNEYDFLNMTTQGDFHHPARFIALLKERFTTIFDQDLRSALGLVDERSYEDYLKKYIEHINAQYKDEKIKNMVTGKSEGCDQYFINEFEKNIELKESPEDFRKQLLSKLGAYYLDNPEKNILYKDVFPEVVNRLQESFRNDQKSFIQQISKNILFFEAEIINPGKKKHPLSEDARDEIERIIKNLKQKHGYSTMGALELLKFIIKERY